MSKEQIDLIERFTVAYNAIDKHLRNVLRKNRDIAFTALVYDYSERHKGWPDAEYLRTVAEMRNFFIHEKTRPYEVMAFPTTECVERLEHVRDRLSAPPRVLPKYQRPVTTVNPDDTLASVLEKVHEKNYSQFPVYQAGSFIGLITENGITRWLASHVARELSLIELDDISVSLLLHAEEKRSNCDLVSGTETVDAVKARFSQNGLLEAVLITNRGNRNEKPLGIVTRWDL